MAEESKSSDRPIDIRPLVINECPGEKNDEYIPMVIGGREIRTSEAGMRIILKELNLC